MSSSIKIVAAAAAVLLLACGCSNTSSTEPKGTTTTASSVKSTTITTTRPASSGSSVSTSNTGATKFTRPSLTTKSTTRLVVTQGTPTARQLLGITYGNLLELLDDTYYVIQQRGHSDVTCALVNKAKFPHYEILDADNAFKDWQYGVSLVDTEEAGRTDAIQNGQTLTAVYVSEGGQLNSKLKVGQSLQTMKQTWSSIPDMTITYDFSGVFNRSYYGYLSFKADNCQVELYVDLTTAEAKKALKARNIVLGQAGSADAEPNMGKTVSLPELSASAAILRLEQKG